MGPSASLPRGDIRSGLTADAEVWHSIGRLHQRWPISPRHDGRTDGAFVRSLSTSPYNNLALLELGFLILPSRALGQGLSCQPLLVDDENCFKPLRAI